MIRKCIVLVAALGCLLVTLLQLGCTTVTRSDGSQVRIPAMGMMGAMAATNITCQDSVNVLITENAKLKDRIAELEAKLAEAEKKQ